MVIVSAPLMLGVVSGCARRRGVASPAWVKVLRVVNWKARAGF
jgi:hypothetical protein